MLYRPLCTPYIPSVPLFDLIFTSPAESPQGGSALLPSIWSPSSSPRTAPGRAAVPPNNPSKNILAIRSTHWGA